MEPSLSVRDRKNGFRLRYTGGCDRLASRSNHTGQANANDSFTAFLNRLYYAALGSANFSRARLIRGCSILLSRNTNRWQRTKLVAAPAAAPIAAANIGIVLKTSDVAHSVNVTEQLI